MPKGYVLDAVETSSGDVWYKARASDGDDYYVHRGQGMVSQEQYAAAKSHSLTASIGERDIDPEQVIENMQMTADRDTAETKGLERGTLARELGGDKNKMLGYINQKFGEIESEEEWIRAVEDYSEFVDEIDEASTQEERRDIKREFGVGAS